MASHANYGQLLKNQWPASTFMLLLAKLAPYIGTHAHASVLYRCPRVCPRYPATTQHKYGQLLKTWKTAMASHANYGQLLKIKFFMASY